MNVINHLAIALTILITLLPSASVSAESPIAKVANADRATTKRIRSNDDSWSIPIASNILGSDTFMHHARGSEKNGGATSGAFDVSAPVGTFVYAPCAGVAKHVSSANEGGYGNNIQVECSSTGLIVWIGHLKEMMVKRGNSVDENTIIGTVGRTGMTSFNHIHITLRGNNGKRIEDHFDMSQFHWAPFASPGGNAFEWDGDTTSKTNNFSKITSESVLMSGASLYGSLALLAIVSYVMLTYMIHALGKDYEPKSRRQFMMGSCHGILSLFIVFSLLTGFNQVLVVEANSTSQRMSEMAFQNTVAELTGSDYSNALAFALSWEEWSCTYDPIKTMGGITQQTYDAWRKSKGFPTQDACKYLKKSEREMILRDNYWVASGADELQWPLSAAVFDTAIGSGPGRSKEFLKKASTFEEYQEVRMAFYKNMPARNNPQSWVNRVNDLNDYIETGKIKGETK